MFLDNNGNITYNIGFKNIFIIVMQNKREDILKNLTNKFLKSLFYNNVVSLNIYIKCSTEKFIIIRLSQLKVTANLYYHISITHEDSIKIHNNFILAQVANSAIKIINEIARNIPEKSYASLANNYISFVKSVPI